MANIGYTEAVLHPCLDPDVPVRYCKVSNCSSIVEGAQSKLYCSKECKNRARRRTSFQSRECPICLKVFSPESGRQSWCTDSCKNEHIDRMKRKRYNEILFIVKDLEKEFASLKSTDEQHEFCTRILGKAQSDYKIRQALTAPGFVKFRRPSSSKDPIYRSLSRKPPKKATSRTIIVIASIQLGDGTIDLSLKSCSGYIPERSSYLTYLGSYTSRIAEIKLKQFEEVMAMNDFRTTLLVDYGHYEPDLEKALEFERLLEVSDYLHDFLQVHSKYFHGMPPHEYLRKTPRPSMNFISDFTDYID